MNKQQYMLKSKNELSPSIREYLEYDEGVEAFRVGEQLEECPYPHGVCRTSWLCGWYDSRTRKHLGHIFKKWNLQFP